MRPSDRATIPQKTWENWRQKEILASPLVRVFWDTLDEEARSLVLNPEKKIGKDYPLNTQDLANLVGATSRQVQHWSKRGLLPYRKDEADALLFESPATIIAFALQRDTGTVILDFCGDKTEDLLALVTLNQIDEKIQRELEARQGTEVTI